MPVLLGLISWLLMGILTGLITWRFLPGQPRLGALKALALGTAGALAGGFLATLLRFGGLASFDSRALALAALTAMLVTLLARIYTLRSW